jgi:hypothetical protein
MRRLVLSQGSEFFLGFRDSHVLPRRNRGKSFSGKFAGRHFALSVEQ